MNDTLRTRLSAITVAANTSGRAVGMRLKTPAGSPASTRTSPTAAADSGSARRA
ncbi:hypothetical protein NKH18_13545 [Streptomyces sp. M10(2022)]